MEMLNVNGFDVNGKEVMEGDYLALDKGDIAYFYKVENGVPKVFANWMIGSLGLINYEQHHEKMMGENVPEVIKKQQKEFYKEITGVKINNLEKVTPKMRSYLDLIQNNGEGHIPLTGSLEEPSEDFEDDDF